MKIKMAAINGRTGYISTISRTVNSLEFSPKGQDYGSVVRIRDGPYYRCFFRGNVWEFCRYIGLSVLERCPYKRGVRMERFHCTQRCHRRRKMWKQQFWKRWLKVPRVLFCHWCGWKVIKTKRRDPALKVTDKTCTFATWTGATLATDRNEVCI